MYYTEIWRYGEDEVVKDCGKSGGDLILDGRWMARWVDACSVFLLAQYSEIPPFLRIWPTSHVVDFLIMYESSTCPRCGVGVSSLLVIRL